MTVRPMHPNCSVPGCERTYYARGLCNAHYLRRLRTGTTDDLRPSFEDRFWGKVDKASDPDGCWLWLAGTARGYGMIDLSHSRRRALAHRVAYELCRICLRMQWRNKKGRAQMSVDVMSPVIGG